MPIPEQKARRAANRHEEAVIQAEIRRLARALRPSRVMPREALARAASWHEGGFERALDAALEAGAIKRRPLGFYGAANPGPGITPGE